MAITVANRNRQIRKEALRDQLSAQGHYQYVTHFLEKMAQLAESAMSPQDKDRFAAYSTLVDKHWRVVDKYVPNLKSVEVLKEETTQHKGTISALAGILERLSHEGDGTAQQD